MQNQPACKVNFNWTKQWTHTRGLYRSTNFGPTKSLKTPVEKDTCIDSLSDNMLRSKNGLKVAHKVCHRYAYAFLIPHQPWLPVAVFNTAGLAVNMCVTMQRSAREVSAYACWGTTQIFGLYKHSCQLLISQPYRG